MYGTGWEQQVKNQIIGREKLRSKDRWICGSCTGETRDVAAHAWGWQGWNCKDADQTFRARNGINNTLGRQPRTGRAGSMMYLSTTGLSW